jgi:hypothetical protein
MRKLFLAIVLLSLYSSVFANNAWCPSSLRCNGTGMPCSIPGPFYIKSGSYGWNITYDFRTAVEEKNYNWVTCYYSHGLVLGGVSMRADKSYSGNQWYVNSNGEYTCGGKATLCPFVRL